MFDHIGVFVSDFEKSIAIYEACFEPLGITVFQRQPEFGAVIFSGESEFPFLWVGTAPEDGDYHGTTLRKDQISPIHIALKAPSKDAVREFYRLGIENGARCNGAPEDCGGGYYAAYLLDPDGNNIEAGITGNDTGVTKGSDDRVERMPIEIELKGIANGAVAYWNEYREWPDRIEQLLPDHNHRGINFVGVESRALMARPEYSEIQYVRPSDDCEFGNIALGECSIRFDQTGAA